jgi:threonine dehydrogenase-like Zn-dependent dehydrogenase
MMEGTTTRAFVFHAPRRGSIEDWEVRDDEVLLDVEACALCQREYHVWHGNIARTFPDVLGHELVGRVVQAPPASGFQRGARVAGMGNFALARRTAVPAWQLTRLEAPFTPQATLVEPLACAVNATNEGSALARPAGVAVVVGLGLLGQLIGEQWAARHGAVIGADLDPSRIATAERAGVKGISLRHDGGTFDEVVAGAGIAFECSGDIRMLERLSRLLPSGSVLSIVAHHRSHEVTAGRLLDLWHLRGLKVWNAVPRTSSSMADCVQAAGRMVRSNRVDLGRFSVRPFDFSDTASALSDWPAGEVFRNVIVMED